jgi:hypothetical protein
VWPDLHGFTRFVAEKEDEHEEHGELDTQIEGKHTHTHTRYILVLLIGLIHQLNRITRKRLQE